MKSKHPMRFIRKCLECSVTMINVGGTRKYCKDCLKKRKNSYSRLFKKPTSQEFSDITKGLKPSVLALSFQHMEPKQFIETFDKIINNELDLIISKKK